MSIGIYHTELPHFYLHGVIITSGAGMTLPPFTDDKQQQQQQNTGIKVKGSLPKTPWLVGSISGQKEC